MHGYFFALLSWVAVISGETIIQPPKLDRPLAVKLNSLRKKIRQLEGVVVAFSGGLDSTVMARLCQQELGDQAVAITVNSLDYPKSDLLLAKKIAKIIGIKHETIDSDKDCVGKMFMQLKSTALEMDVQHVVSGTHFDDEQNGSFSFAASKEHKIKTPLHELKINKAEIVKLSKHLGLPISKHQSKRIAQSFLHSLSLSSTKLIVSAGSGSLIISSKNDLIKISALLPLIEQRFADLGFKKLSLMYTQKIK